MKIWKHYNEKTKRDQWQARFVINGKQLRPKADTKKELELIINEIRRAENREDINKKHRTDLKITCYIPTLAELFGKVLTIETSQEQKQFANRVFDDFLNVLPPDIKVNQLTTFNFEGYINHRRGQLGKHTKEPLKPQTINKELYAISGGLKMAPKFFAELENWRRPPIPFLPEEDSARGLNLKMEEFYLILDALRKEKTGKQTLRAKQHQHHLADDLEFRLETGLRRKEVARLQFKQYNRKEGILENVRRWKTKTTTKVFPLSKKAIELVELRHKTQAGLPFIFTSNGKPVESYYRTLKTVCGKLNIPYGRYTEDGFVPHDLRHQAGTEIVRLTDIETAREYLGHSNIKQTGVYLHTDATRLKEAVRRRDDIRHKKIDIENLLKNSFDEIKQGIMTKENFLEIMNKTFEY